jgi:hypothetical protein
MASRQGRALPQRSRSRSSAKPSPAVTDPTREVPLQVLVPSHVRKQVEFLTVETGESLRSVVLRALREIGVRMTDAEMRGRRSKPR